MNIWKLAAGIAPALALFATSAEAQLCSGSDVGCPVTAACEGQIHRTPLGDPRFMDSDEPSSAATLTVDQFDPAVWAAFHGVPVSDITLLGVEVQLTADTSGIAYMHRTDPAPGSCTANWQIGFATTLDAEPSLGTPALQTNVVAGEDGVLLSANTPCPIDFSHEYQKNYADVAGAVLTDADCVCITDDLLLPNWTGASTVSWTANIFDNSQFTSVDCFGDWCNETQAQSMVSVEVVYVYCVEDDIPPPGGCVCRDPSAHYRRPGSLLLYPEFDNREGDLTLFTITNTDCSGEDVDVEFMFIDADDCSEFNTTITLTPCDTFTAITNVVNPNMTQGYFYAFAKDDEGNAITHNGLIGNAMVISGVEQFDYSVNPVSFLGMTADRAPTDLDDDGVRDLDGLEYDKAPDTITIPRFLGQGVDSMGEGAPVDSHLILIGLSGGQDFETTICFDVYNDNEEGFSGEYTFYCWEKPTLLEVRGTFANSFLLTTDHDPNEILGAANRRESGWICIDGCFATSTQETIADPAFYAVLVERISSYSASDLPFECGMQDNGALLPRGLFGDGDPTPENNDNQ